MYLLLAHWFSFWDASVSAMLPLTFSLFLFFSLLSPHKKSYSLMLSTEERSLYKFSGTLWVCINLDMFVHLTMSALLFLFCINTLNLHHSSFKIFKIHWMRCGLDVFWVLWAVPCCDIISHHWRQAKSYSGWFDPWHELWVSKYMSAKALRSLLFPFSLPLVLLEV